jgi:protein gp37
MSENGPRWTGKLVMVPEHLDDPTRWKRPRRIFVNSMSDLFHEKLSDEQIATVFRVMLNAPRHTYQVLTKRAKRMHDWVRWFEQERGEALPRFIWLGVSAEDQENANARVPLLLATNAHVRFVSAEPLIGAIDFANVHPPGFPYDKYDALRGIYRGGVEVARLDWVIVGGESGREARPFDVEWARSIVRQCRAADAAPFVKQLGGKPFDSTGAWESRDVLPSHGPPIEEWDPTFSAREFPAVAA